MKLAVHLLLSTFFLLVPKVFAQSSDGVLVSPPFQDQGSNQNSTGSSAGGNASNTSNASNASNQGNSSTSNHHKHQQANGDSDTSSQNTSEDNNNGAVKPSSSPTDDIVVKATNAVIFQMTSNLKLTQDQISTVQPIVADNIAQVRDLQQSLQDGTIDSATMVSQKQELTDDENEELSSILTQDQMKTWMNMQNDPAHKNKESSSK